MSETMKKSEPLVSKGRTANGKKGLVLLVVGIIVLVAIIAFLVMTIFVSPVKGSAWYGIFLTNGRTYFGHIVKQNSQTVVLRDVYYLQVQQIPPTEEGVEPQPQITLINVSDDLHSPESEMQISRAHILYVQKLKESSQVVTTIKQLSQE
ncbi:hypothetical protein KKG58_03705 [Patescibacteria group bacterium]|nr:hypothetical protein [Patescibacteria group bacterium]